MGMLSQYLSPDLVLFLNVATRDEVLALMVERLAQAHKLKDKKAFHHAILERERLVSTGIGAGIAIPHAKLPTYDDFFIAIAIHRQGVDWSTLDGSPARIIFMIGGPDDKQTQYLRILSRVTAAVKEEEIRKKLLQLTDPVQIIELFEPF